jgi:oxygen-independent coproporphyrinogen-3 oxidase
VGAPSVVGASFGVYVHIPFCARRCDYCAFATWTDRHHLMESYTAACVAEVGGAVADGMPPAGSVFFGGGTPSLLAPSLLMSILSSIPVVPGAEVTVECNPDTVTLPLLAAYVAGGVTRLSLGVQSMAPHVLAGLGRTHDPSAVRRAVELAREAGLTNFNVDLIYGSPLESDADWLATLDAVLALSPSHVSAYALTVEPGTPLAADPARHPDDDVQAGRYEMADSVLAGAGFDNYEISNWARPGHECRHNLLYWAQGNYRGIGCAAHSHQAGRRWWNLRTPERYLAAVASGGSVVAGSECLDGDAREFEALSLGLRTRVGVPAETVDAGSADELRAGGLLSLDGGQIVLTRAGRLLANEVAVRLAR